MSLIRKSIALVAVLLAVLLSLVAVASADSHRPDVTTTAVVGSPQVGATNPGFTAVQNCPYEGWGWRFTLNDTNWRIVALTATFADEEDVSSPLVISDDGQTVYVWSQSYDILTDVAATVSADHAPGQVPPVPPHISLVNVCWDGSPFPPDPFGPVTQPEATPAVAEEAPPAQPVEAEPPLTG